MLDMSSNRARIKLVSNFMRAADSGTALQCKAPLQLRRGTWCTRRTCGGATRRVCGLSGWGEGRQGTLRSQAEGKGGLKGKLWD